MVILTTGYMRVRGGDKDRETLNLVLERLKAYKPEKNILFGSYARGEADEYSDLDFVVIKRRGGAL
jgi:Predicted nucleotidyltransferases